MNETGYVVLRAPDGDGETYIGTADTLQEARRLVRRHERGTISDTPSSLWSTARAAGVDRPGCAAPPPHDEDPIEWLGRDGYYCICREVSVDQGE